MKGKRLLGSVMAATLVLVLMAGLALAQTPAVSPLGTAFTYQGQLKSDGAPYNGACDLKVGLWDALNNGNQLGTQTVTNVSLTDGYFTVQLDYGEGKFLGEARWLDISVRCPAGSGSYTPLTPRQPLTPTPYALYGKAAPWSGLTGVPAGFADGVDNDTTYSAGTGLTLSGTTFSADTAYLQRRVSGTCTTGNAIRVVNADGTVTCQAVDANAWLLTGNAGTAPGTNFVGTTDNQALELKVNNARALRLEPSGVSPNLIGGYSGNSVTAGVYGATIGGGGQSSDSNRVTDLVGTVAGGLGNQAGDNAGTIDDARAATVGGGAYNTASGEYAAVGGGSGNTASGEYAAIGGGAANAASGQDATVGGGLGNLATFDHATVSGGYSNTASGAMSTVGGGQVNTASGYLSSVGGGHSNFAGYLATVGGGDDNSATAQGATVGGGEVNTASGLDATVGGGYHNAATAQAATVAGGYENQANGVSSMVLGGTQNLADGTASFAGGYRAHAHNPGCFVWADFYTAADLNCSVDNRWMARASGGVYFYTNTGLTSGVYVAAGGNGWNGVSDRATKESFAPADGQAILEKLASLPVQEYNLKSQDPTIRHIGLVAQEFAVFGYGESDTSINMQDADGVAMAAIQGLYAENQALKAQVASLQQQNADLDARLTALEEAGPPGQPKGQSRVPALWLFAGGLVVAGGTLAARRRSGGGR